jgi:hypothetical protein
MTISNATTERLAVRDLIENGLARRRRLDPLRHSLGGRQLVFRDLVSSPRPGLHPRHNRRLEQERQHPSLLRGQTIDLARARARTHTKMTIW